MFQKFLIRSNERALLFKKGSFIGILTEGEYKFLDWFKKDYSIEIYNLKEPYFQHDLLDFLWENAKAKLEKYIEYHNLTENEFALVYLRNKVIDILWPESQIAIWKNALPITIKKFPIENDQIVDKNLYKSLYFSKDVTLQNKFMQCVTDAEVSQYYQGLLYVDGQLKAVLPAGNYAYWRFNQKVSILVEDTRIKLLEIQGQELLTKDKVTLRVNLTANYQFSDVKKAYEKTEAPVEFLYKELQFGLRSAISTKTLDQLLEEREAISEVVLTYIKEKIQDHGLEVHSIGVKDIILPGEMRTLLAKVVEAEKAAQANIILRREETAATRSMMNTAKVMDNNPTALRLKELEVLEKIADKIDNLSVYGGLDSIVKELVKFNKN